MRHLLSMLSAGIVFRAATRFPRLNAIWVALWAVAVAGCLAIPQQELTAYRDAFAETQRAGDLLYDEVSLVVTANTPASEQGCVLDAAGIPVCFDPDAVTGEVWRNEHASVRARRIALALVTEYTQALVDLAEGKSADALVSRADNLRGLATDVLAFGGIAGFSLPAFLGSQPLFAAFTALAERLESLRAGVTIRQSLIAERETIREVVSLLIADTRTMYKIYLASQRDKFGRTGNADHLAAILTYEQALTDYVLILKQAESVHRQLAESSTIRLRSVADLRVAIKEASEIKRVAEDFWVTVRDLRT